jgi:hypothetical protein
MAQMPTQGNNEINLETVGQRIDIDRLIVPPVNGEDEDQGMQILEFV